MLVCDKHRGTKGKPRVARYSLLVYDLNKPESNLIEKDFCFECGQKLAAIVNAFAESLEREEDLSDQIEEILAKKTKEMEKEEEVHIAR